MNVLGIIIIFVVLAVVFFASSRWACLGMIAGALYLTQGQQVEVLGFNVFAMRFIEIGGFIRVISRGEFSFKKMNTLDRTLLLLYSYTTVVFLLRSPDGQAYQIGTAVDALLCYFAFRGLCRNLADFKWFMRAFVVLLTPYVAMVMYESVTAHNVFSAIGGIVLGQDWFRAGRPRAVGSFRHPSLLGTLGASLIPLYIGLWLSKANRALAAFAVVLCLAVVWASNSGGPAGCVLVAIAGWLLWGLRAKMYLFRRGMVALLVAALLFMKAPVWYLLARVSDITGGDGWHRSYLLDMAYQHLGHWWLAGMAPRETAVWFPYVLAATGAADMTNNYLNYGIAAGLGALALFLLLLTRGFISIGKSLAVIRASGSARKADEYLFWSLGVVLAVHVFNWFGITYFDQTYVFWFMQLAVISNLTQEVLSSSSNTVNLKTRSIGLMKPSKDRSSRPELVRPAFRN